MIAMKYEILQYESKDWQSDFSVLATFGRYFHPCIVQAKSYGETLYINS
jgi:hypothetical protein